MNVILFECNSTCQNPLAKSRALAPNGWLKSSKGFLYPGQEVGISVGVAASLTLVFHSFMARLFENSGGIFTAQTFSVNTTLHF